MRKPVPPHSAVFLFLCTVAPLSAQNVVSNDRPSDFRTFRTDYPEGSDGSRFSEKDPLPDKYSVPSIRKASAQLPDGGSVYISQDAKTLEIKNSAPKNVESTIDLEVLRQPSAYRKIFVSTGSPNGQRYHVSDTALEDGLTQISAAYREAGKSSQAATDCPVIGLSIEKRIATDTSKVLELVESEVGANPGCACEVVKAAIRTTNADTTEVVAIVETAIHASPESMRMVSQCAIAETPDSLTAIQALLARLDPNAGDAGTSAKSAKSSKDAKDSKVATMETPVPPNPLDRPPPFPPVVPPPVNPPPVTDVDPGNRYPEPNDRYTKY